MVVQVVPVVSTRSTALASAEVGPTRYATSTLPSMRAVTALQTQVGYVFTALHVVPEPVSTTKPNPVPPQSSMYGAARKSSMKMAFMAPMVTPLMVVLARIPVADVVDRGVPAEPSTQT